MIFSRNPVDLLLHVLHFNNPQSIRKFFERIALPRRETSMRSLCMWQYLCIMYDVRMVKIYPGFPIYIQANLKRTI